METKKLTFMTVFGAALTLMLSGCLNDESQGDQTEDGAAAEDESSSEEVTTLTFQQIYTAAPAPEGFEGAAGFGAYLEDWAAEVEEFADGRLEIEILPPDSVVASGEILDAISNGVLDGGFVHPALLSQSIPEAGFISTAYAWSSPDEIEDYLYNRGAEELLQEAFNEQNVYFIPIPDAGIYGLHSRVPINGPEDLAGLKVRAPSTYGVLFGDYHGAAPVAMSAGESYTGLQLGTIDAAYFAMSVLETAKTKEVIDYLITGPEMATGTMMAVTINMDKFNELPEDIREFIETSSFDIMYETASRNLEFEEAHAQQANEEFGVELINWDEEDMDNLLKPALPELWEGFATNERTDQLYEILLQQARDTGKIDE